jgi:hypothetical protein
MPLHADIRVRARSRRLICTSMITRSVIAYEAKSIEVFAEPISCAPNQRPSGAQGGLASLCRLMGSSPHIDAGGDARTSWAWVSESDDGTRLSFPSTDPGREEFQPNAVVDVC